MAAQADNVRSDSLLAEKRLNDARLYHKNHDFAAEIVVATEATGIFARLYGHDHPKTAQARLFIARGLRDTNCEREALDLYYQSLPVFEIERDTFRQAICHHQIGLCLRKQYRFRAAHEHTETALALLRPDSVRHAPQLADMHLAAGATLNAEKRFAAAIPPLEKAREIYTKQQTPEGLGYAAYHIGNAWFGLNDFARAKEQFLFSLSKLKDLLKPGDSYFADLYTKIGLCCQRTSASEAGLRYLLEARDIYLREGVDGLNYIQFLQDLGQFYLREKQPKQAIEQLEACVSAQEKYYGGRDLHLIRTLQALGEAYGLAHRYEQAEACYRQILHIVAENLGGDYAQSFHIYSKLAELSFSQGKWNNCLQRCDTAFAIAGYHPESPQEVLPRDYFRELCLLYSRALYQQWQQDADNTHLVRSEQYATRAAETLFQEVEEITVNSSREIFYDLDHPVLEHLLDVRMSLYATTGEALYAEAAFQIAGKSKAFLLAEAMQRNGALHFAGVPDSVVQAEQSLRERIAFAEKQTETAGFQTETDSNALWKNQALSDWRQDYDALLRRIERDYPDYFRLRKLGRDVSSTELRRRALAPDQALLLYSLTATNRYAFVLTRDTFVAHALPTDTLFDETLEKFQKSLTAYYSASNPDDALYDTYLETYIAAAQGLYQKLVAPVVRLLPDRVVIIPDGKLWRLPFEALLTGTPTDAGNFRTYPFWMREKALSFCLSPHLLLENATPPKKQAEKRWLGLAPFADHSANTNGPSRNTQGSALPLLPFSGQEVSAIAALLKGDVWTGNAAQPGRFRAEAHRYGILHLATHSRADDRQGDYSFVATSQNGDPLPAKDLFALSLHADMVVLSACEAGDGKLLRGEGIIGLVRGFVYAGARSVVASQWVAHDKSTANLMVEFYRNLQRGLPKDHALRAAQINQMNQFPAQAHPFFWAGFRVYGSTL